MKLLINHLLNALLLTSSFSPVLIFYFLAKASDENPIVITTLELIAPTIVSYLISLWCIKILKSKSANETARIQEIRPVELQVIPAFIGMFVISLSLMGANLPSTLLILCGLLIFWCIFSKVSYYNIFFSLMGYRFYEAKLSMGSESTFIILITKTKNLKTSLSLTGLKRINDYVYLEVH